MDGRAHFILERRRDKALPFDARLASEAGGNHRHAKMGLAFRPVARMALVKVGLVHYLKPLRQKSSFKLAAYRLRDGHETTRYANR